MKHLLSGLLAALLPLILPLSASCLQVQTEDEILRDFLWEKLI